jgi:peroxiredoxin
MSLIELPADLAIPKDDGACDHLSELELPNIELSCTDGSSISIDGLTRHTVIYIYPMTGQPDVALPVGWDSIPGARGCTPQSCGFRDLHDELEKYATIYGLSSQTTEYQQEAKSRLHLPFELLSDTNFTLKEKLIIPTFIVDEIERYKRLTLIIEDSVIRKVFYPVFPPDKNAVDVLNWFENRS